MNALRNLGPIEAARCVGSYLWVRVRPPKNRDTLEGFIASRFGWRMYQHFFKTYNEKVWGVPASELSADWGAQRIKNLSLFRAVWEALKPKRLRAGKDKTKQVTSLIEEFNYPKFGPGMMWETAADAVTAAGATLHFSQRVTSVRHAGGWAVEVETVDDNGTTHTYPCTHVISSMPIGALLQGDGSDGRRAHARGRRRHPLPRPPHRRARRPAGVLVQRQLDLRARPGGRRSVGCRTSVRGRRTW